ncbi:MAG: hypothetical protein KHY99_17625, partial [Acinetobacter sp.]|uniref:hypothetical protein n=1 Tax=Acinetobacter sp. TaxID=472 RepID=UPI00257E2BE3
MKCLNKVIIAVPIKYNNRTIGVIGAISTDKTKKVEISAKIDNYLKFVNHICDLISMKIEEHEASKNSSRKMDMMIEIIENVEKGVIILDINSKISYINNIALKKLDIDKNIIENIVNIVSVESSSNEKWKTQQTSIQHLPPHKFNLINQAIRKKCTLNLR